MNPEETTVVPEVAPEETIVVPEESKDYTEQLNKILEAIEKGNKDYLDQLPTPEETEKEQQLEQQLQQDLITYRESQLKLLEEIKTGNGKIAELITVSPDYSASYEKQQTALENVFDGVNVLIGLILGVGVAIAFIKGFGQ